MAPILIDNRDLLKIGIISTLVITLAFSGGFFMGSQQATTASQAGNEIQSLSLPEKIIPSKSIAESQAPSTIEAGEKMDVDQPRVATKATSQVNKGSKKKRPDPVKVSASASVLEKVPEKNKKLKSNSQRAVKEKDNSANTLVNVLPNKATATGQPNKIKYSIQVGVYVRLVNAKNMMEMLKVQQYDAYVTDFINKNNETRYNVRVGYFINKKSAFEILKKFKADQKSDGYLVNFSAQNIVDTANTDVDTDSVKKTVNVPTINNKVNDEIKKEPSPIIPIDSTQDKISRADI